MMEHRGYRGVVSFDDEAEVLFGEVIGTRDMITFEGESVEEVQVAFRDSVDGYLEFCEERGREPDKPFSGKIPLRISPDLHRAATEAARASGKSLNAWLTETVSEAVR